MAFCQLSTCVEHLLTTSMPPSRRAILSCLYADVLFDFSTSEHCDRKTVVRNYVAYLGRRSTARGMTESQLHHQIQHGDHKSMAHVHMAVLGWKPRV
jgi:hypothetical protein